MELRFQLLANTIVFLVAIVSEKASAARYFGNETDRLALLELKHRISDDPYGVLKSWNDSQQHCQWRGVTCDARHKRVMALALQGKNLFGSISPHIGNLSFLKSIEFGENRLYGDIPREISHLFRLKNLNLSSNNLSGKIPANLSQCSELRILNVNHSRLTGKIPFELGYLQKLVYLNLAVNNLTGEIPPSLGNLSSLSFLVLAENNLEGYLPSELGLLANLFVLSVHVNKLTGKIPPSLYNISVLNIIFIGKNFLHGSFPADLGLKLPKLQVFGVAMNQFSGTIPVSIANATGLKVLGIFENKFEGQVPTNLGNLPNLERLNLATNFLGHNSNDDLDFITSLKNCSSLRVLSFAFNNFGGKLPSIIANLSVQLRELYMGSNKIYGTIPTELPRYASLYLLGMENNRFTGIIPSDFGQFQNLQGLYLSGNQLSGQIPSTVWNVTSLYILILKGNNFEGKIPPNLGNCQRLKVLDISRNKLTGVLSPNIFGLNFSPIYLDLSHNSLAGFLPLELGRMTSLFSLNISYNNFSGEIRAIIGDCESLEYLQMQGNLFQGEIPSNLASLKAIQYLDLSQSNLTGKIPSGLGKLSFLNYLNLSFNDLDGEVPTDGVFTNKSRISLAGNAKLCGGIPELHLPSCVIHGQKNVKHPIIIVMCMLIPAIMVSVVLVSYYLRRDGVKGISSVKASKVDKILRLSYLELHQATAGFSSENVIGSGSFGLVYKGSLARHGNRVVAVKVLNLQTVEASKSFKAECIALRNIRHRNLVRLLTYCSTIDFRGHEIKALVYEFMENGSLDMWLHSETTVTTRSTSLNLLQRINIGIDVASAMNYLHSYSGVVIVHCDIKPSNILLDNDLVAHVGDFGSSRLLPKTTKSSSLQSSSNTIPITGTIGYAAPEYGMGHEVSTEGDVYSYGILLLEMLTGRRPTDDIFIDGHCLHDYVKLNLIGGQVMEIIDPLLLLDPGVEINDEMKELEEINENPRYFLSGENNLRKYLVSILEIGLKCSARSPNDRMHMNEVLRLLQLIKNALLVCMNQIGSPS